MLGRRQLMRQEGTNGTRNRDFKEQLRLGNEMKTRRNYRKSIGLEIAKPLARCTIRLRRIKDWTLWRGRPPPKQKITAVRGGAGNIKAPTPTTTEKKRGDFIRVPLRSSAHAEERWKWLESGHHNPEKKQQTRGNTVPERKRRCCKHSPWRKRNVDIPLEYSGRTALRREQCGVPPKSMII
jgi:hypothetical protein